MITAERLIKLLNLQPHPEGGYYAETYRSNELIPKEALLERYAGPSSWGTAIYYLLTPQTFSAIHRLATDEIYHFYLGDPVVLILLQQDGSGRLVTLGSDVESGLEGLGKEPNSLTGENTPSSARPSLLVSILQILK